MNGAGERGRWVVGITLPLLVSLGCASPPLPQHPVATGETPSPAARPVAEAPASPPPVAPAPPPSAPVREGADIRADIGETLVLNGVDFGRSPTLASFEAVLGKADRAVEKVNRIHVYERFGMILYEPYDGSITAVVFYFAPENFVFMPRALYRGRIKFGALALDGSVTSAALAAIPGMQFDSMFQNYKYKAGYSLILDVADGRLVHVDIEFEKKAGKLPPPPGSNPVEVACVRGDAKQCTLTSLAYQVGAGVPKDAGQAYKYARRACDGGDGAGCTMQATLLSRGDVATPAPGEVAKLFAKGCRLGDKLGCAAK